MAGKVFISCGQRPPRETEIASKVRDILKELGLDPYLAFKVQSLNDIMTITKELRSSDYYLFIDFLRTNKPEDLPVSLFTHQELALAHNLEFQDIIALQQVGAPLEGFIKYVLSNPEPFSDEGELYEKLRTLVKARNWSKDFSRNLVVSGGQFSSPVPYTDRSGSFVEKIYTVRVHNHRPDVAAVGTVCILDSFERLSGGFPIDSSDRAYLKWAGQAGYERTILPEDYGEIDILSIHQDQGGIFLHSLSDTPRVPIVQSNGGHKMHFKLFARDFPLVKFCVEVDLKWAPASLFTWIDASTARLCRNQENL
jgi:hypothetical protein